MEHLWHKHNPWKDKIVYVPLERLAECVAEGEFTAEKVLALWREYGDELDAYILPQPSGLHSVGIRYGKEGSDYLSPYAKPNEVAKLLKEFEGNV